VFENISPMSFMWDNLSSLLYPLGSLHEKHDVHLTVSVESMVDTIVLSVYTGGNREKILGTFCIFPKK